MLLLVQARVLLAFFATRAYCWFMITSVSTRTPRAFSAKLFPAGGSPASPGAQGCSSPAAGLCASLLWTSWGSCLPFLQPTEIPLNSSAAFCSIGLCHLQSKLQTQINMMWIVTGAEEHFDLSSWWTLVAQFAQPQRCWGHCGFKMTCQSHGETTVQKGHLSCLCCIMPFPVTRINQLHGKWRRNNSCLLQNCSSSEIQEKCQRLLTVFFSFCERSCFAVYLSV